MRGAHPAKCDITMQRYLDFYKTKRAYIPLILIVLFIVASRIWHTSVLYYYTLLYLLLILYSWRVFTAKPPKGIVRRGKKLWIAAIVTAVALFLARFAERALAQWLILKVQDDGVLDVTTRETADFIVYIIVMMFLQPIAEGLVFRGKLVSFRDRQKTIVTTAVTIIMIVMIHADGLVGIPMVLIPLIPLTACYLTTRNTVLCIILHVFYCIYDNYEFVGYAFARMIYQYN